MSRTVLITLVGGVVLAFLGSCSILIGVIFLFDVGQPISSTNSAPMALSTALCPIFLGLPFLGLGGALTYVSLRQKQRTRRETIEAKVIQAAIARNYRITPAEVAMLTDLSLTEAREYLETLARSGQIAVEIGENGMLIYCFRRT